MPKFQLERTIVIKASAASVFSNVKDFMNWAIWSPWILAEPGCQLIYAENGKSFSWNGDIIGSGEMEVLDSLENEAIHYRLTFLKPFKSVSTVSFHFKQSNGETNTKWTMSGSLPLFLFWMKKMMVAGMSMDFDRGLRLLKDHVELGSIPSKLKFTGIETVKEFSYVGLSRDCDFAELSKLMAIDIERVGASVKAACLKVTGGPVCFYDSFDVTKGAVSYTVAVPVEPGIACPDGLVKGKRPTVKNYAIHHTGAYRHLGNPWAAGLMHQRAKLFEHNKSMAPFEVYRSDPNKVSEEELLTSVYFPIK